MNTAVTTSDEAPVTNRLAEYACARCWKHKKMCDRRKPKCGRCIKQAGVCLFVPHPPKECILTVISGRETQRPTGSKASRRVIKGAQAYETAQADDQRPPGSYSIRNNVNSPIVDQLDDILGGICNYLEIACKTYFRTLHSWLPFLCEIDFWRRFSSLGKARDADFVILVIGMYLLTHSPSQNTEEVDVDFVYSAVKHAWIQAARTGGSSLSCIEGGLLLATYEHGQALEEQKRLSMSICIEAGKAKGLDQSLRQSVTQSPIDEIQIAKRRRLWWAILIHERLFAQANVGQGYSYETKDPVPSDYLPFDTDEFSAKDLFVGMVHHEQHGSDSSITFPEVNAFARLSQAVYLLRPVEEFIQVHLSIIDEAANQDSIKLDGILQTLICSLLRQSAGTTSKGRYCTAYFLCIVSLGALHQHMLTLHSLKTENREAQSFLDLANTCPRSVLALQSLARMYRDISMTKTQGSSADFLQVPPYEMYALYIGAVLHMQAGDRTDKAEWELVLEHTITFMSLFTAKWKIAAVYLQKLESMRRNLGA